MWRADESGRPRIPKGDSDLVPYKPLWGEVEVNPAKRNAEKEVLRASKSIEKKSFIINGIAKYIQYWRSGMARNARYAAEMSCFVDYWERIHRKITGPLPSQPDKVQDGFWPSSDWKRDHARSCSIENDPTHSTDLAPEDDSEPYPLCGPAKKRPRPNFNPYHDVLLGDFVLCRPSHNNHLPVWLGRALTCVDNTPGENYGRFTMEWWTPMKGKREGKCVLARECWTRRWEKELTLPEVIHCSIVLFSHRLPSHRKSGPPVTHVIPEASAAAAMAMLASHGIAMDADEEWED
jgi:hypothetical protein